jgi:hypothetical protein
MMKLYIHTVACGIISICAHQASVVYNPSAMATLFELIAVVAFVLGCFSAFMAVVRISMD